ncbi:MAG: hypothetical protein WCB53_11640 [Terriglobales bacterium]
MKKKRNIAHGGQTSDDLSPEYQFDYAKARSNRFAGRGRKSIVVLLAPDVAKVFKDGASVNDALRAILKAMPRRSSASSR